MLFYEVLPCFNLFFLNKQPLQVVQLTTNKLAAPHPLGFIPLLFLLYIKYALNALQITLPNCLSICASNMTPTAPRTIFILSSIYKKIWWLDLNAYLHANFTTEHK